MSLACQSSRLQAHQFWRNGDFLPSLPPRLSSKTHFLVSLKFPARSPAHCRPAFCRSPGVMLSPKPAFHHGAPSPPSNFPSFMVRVKSSTVDSTPALLNAQGNSSGKRVTSCCGDRLVSVFFPSFSIRLRHISTEHYLPAAKHRLFLRLNSRKAPGFAALRREIIATHRPKAVAPALPHEPFLSNCSRAGIRRR